MSTNQRQSVRRLTTEHRLLGILTPFAAAIIGFAAVGVILLALGANPVTAFRSLVAGSLGDRNSIADTLVKATPLLFVATGICVAFRAGAINIGGEGQFIVGALGASFVAIFVDGLPGWAIIVVGSLLGLICGMVWGGIAGALKAYLGVNEILTTVMLNFVAALIMSGLVSGPWIDPAQREAGTRIPQTERFPRSADLPRWEPTRLHLGLLVAIVAAVLIWVMLWRTPHGYRIRAVGQNPHASRYAGISVERGVVVALAISGAMAGLGGAIQVLGVDHRLYSEGAAAGFTGGAGFNGIVVALFGGLHPLGAIPAAALFGALLVGANYLQRTMQVPSSLATVMNGIIVLVVVSSGLLVIRRRRAIEMRIAALDEAAAAEQHPPPPRSGSEAVAPSHKETSDVV